MRRMYSEKQIKNLIEEDLSNVVVTKGQYTTDASIKMTRVGHCTTVAGYINVNNTSGDTISNLPVFSCKNLFTEFIDNVDGDEFALNQNNNNSYSFSTGYISLSDETTDFIIRNIPVGNNGYYFDIDIIDAESLPVEDYPGE